MDECIELLADYVDLKIPREVGRSRKTAELAEKMAASAGFDSLSVKRIKRAALLHKLGQVSVGNRTLENQDPAEPVSSEACRLIPYWTERILSRCPEIEKESRIASYACERLDGSGYHRGVSAAAIPVEARFLQVAALVSQIQTMKPAMTVRKIAAILKHSVERQELDAIAVDSATQVIGNPGRPVDRNPALRLTVRETDVLLQLARGLSNKEIARALGLSPKTVGTHVENLYLKLNISSRAAAVIKAQYLGLLACA